MSVNTWHGSVEKALSLSGKHPGCKIAIAAIADHRHDRRVTHAAGVELDGAAATLPPEEMPAGVDFIRVRDDHTRMEAVTTMEVSLTRVNERAHFVARNPEGNEVHLDGSGAVGGEEAGFRPMQLLLSALAGRASVDLSDILRKQRAGVRHIEILASGERGEGVPAPFTSLHLHFRLYGEVDRAKAERALDLAVNHYCSVGEMLRKAAPLTYDYEILSADAARRPAAASGEGA